MIIMMLRGYILVMYGDKIAICDWLGKPSTKLQIKNFDGGGGGGAGSAPEASKYQWGGGGGSTLSDSLHGSLRISRISLHASLSHSFAVCMPLVHLLQPIPLTTLYLTTLRKTFTYSGVFHVCVYRCGLNFLRTRSPFFIYIP